MIHVAVVSEVRFFRECLVRYLDGIKGIVVTADAGTAAEVRAEPEVPIDVLVLDVGNGAPSSMPFFSEAAGQTRVVVIGLPESEAAVLAYAEEGIAGFVARGSTLDELSEAIVSASSDELICTPSLAGALLRLVGQLAMEHRVSDAGANLTARELEIVTLIDEGLSNKQIAAALHIEVSTVKNHVHHILEKLNVGGRGQAAAVLRSSGLDRKH